MIFAALRHALGQTGDPVFRRVIWLGLALAVALLFAMYAALLLVIQIFTADTLTIPIAGEVRGLGTLLSVGSLFFMLVLSIFLMVPVASAFTGLFLDDVADAVEARHYPQLSRAPRASLWVTLTDSGRYFALLIGLNLLGILVFALSGGLGIVGLWLLNGFLLAREYFTMIALRRLSPEDARAMRSRHQPRIWATGVLMAIPLSIPLVNLFVPVLGAAAFTHLFHQLNASTPAPQAADQL
ncbi:MAG: EI24 domain-containing protein [Pararhodobacter sp.]|nr:EI24 domain-containing protein [Pararhodobacter sp.]